MKKIILIMSLFSMLLLSMALVYAHGNFNETKKLIDSEISCDKLTDEQLEAIGDYYMEQMHPGEAHEMMHDMMGGEDSEMTKQMHINMAKSIYCGEQNQGMMGMMSMMMGGNMTSSGGMMDGGMMSGGMMTGKVTGMNMMNYGSGMAGDGSWNLIYILYIILIICLIILVLVWIIKILKELNKKKR